MLLPELIQTELLPKFASQPAVAEHARSSQLQPTQAHWHAVRGVAGKLPVVGKQTHSGEALFRIIEYLQRVPPRRLLLIVDLSQIQHGALRRLATRQATVLHDAEVTVIIVVFVAIGAAQKHALAAECQRFRTQKRAEVCTQPSSWPLALTALGILPPPAGKPAPSAAGNDGNSLARTPPVPPPRWRRGTRGVGCVHQRPAQ